MPIEKINEAIKTQVWLRWVGEYFRSKCLVDWCQNEITARDFDVGHNIPKSKGGKTQISNLVPICRKCNLSMGNRFTIEEWSKTFSEKKNKLSTNCIVWSLTLVIILFWFYYYHGFKLLNSFTTREWCRGGYFSC
jgi:5-methylcytosine-specific restriction endonuclease McrA